MTTILFDFSHPDAASTWSAIDDRVMGGVSASRLRHSPEGCATFEGYVSLERNGGFASVRSRPGAFGQHGAQACEIEVREVRGDSKRYKLSLIADDAFDSINYQTRLMPTGGDWQILRLPIADFRASFRGREVPGAPPLDPARIRQVGLLIADRQQGLFSLQIRRISLA